LEAGLVSCVVSETEPFPNTKATHPSSAQFAALAPPANVNRVGAPMIVAAAPKLQMSDAAGGSGAIEFCEASGLLDHFQPCV
jgi:hypothetical protein